MPCSVRACLAACLTVLVLRPSPVAAQTAELRGVWITNVDSDVLSTRAKIAEAMDYLATRGFNVVYPVVYNGGYTLYPSDVMVQTFGESYRTHPSFAGRDVLAEVIFEAHRAGLEVVPWFEYGFAASFESNGGHILRLKPDWAALCAPGATTNCDAGRVKKNGFFWLDALNPEVQAYMSALVLEVARRYDVDGVQGDDRLPAMAVEGGYTAVDRALYAQDHGGAAPPTFARDPGFVQWKARRLTRYLGTLYRGVKAVDPNLTVSMSPSPYSFGYDEYLQDSPRWLDSSYVDTFHPQLYRFDLGQYRFEVQKALSFTRAQDRAKLFPGVLIKSGSRLAHPDTVVAAVRYNRQNGINGEVFFFYEGLRSRNPKGAVGDSLRKYVYTTPARVPGRRGERRPRATIVNETDAGVTSAGWADHAPSPGYAGTMRRATAASGATATYRFTPPVTATYNAYAYVPGFSLNRPDATGGAYVALSNGTDSTVVRVDQAQSVGTGWRLLGSVNARAGTPVTVTVRAGLAADGKATYTDAVLWLLDRQRSPDVVVGVAESPTAPPTPGLTVRLAPNPARGLVTVRVDAEEARYGFDVRVFDLLGRAVAHVPLEGSSPASVSTDALAPGVYVVQVAAGGRTATARLVVSR